MCVCVCENDESDSQMSLRDDDDEATSVVRFVNFCVRLSLSLLLIDIKSYACSLLVYNLRRCVCRRPRDQGPV